MTLQYFKPPDPCFVGDCMPFSHGGTFRLYYLRDEGHHSALGGLGGHQWAQASSTDLVHWQHHPLAIPLTEPDEGSICTGSVLCHAGTYYGFYATRRRDRTQHLSLATSTDGVHFRKQEPNPFASPPPGYDPHHFRDPVVFRDPEDGRFHLLATAWLTDHPVAGRGGCLAHLVSADLRHWEQVEPFLVPGLPGAPECPDHFEWNGWYYLLFSNSGVARYRMAPSPLGPWQRPAVDTLDGPAARVMKTAAWGPDRRLGVAWIGTRRDDVDGGPFQFGGHAVWRELVQHPDGTLGTGFPPELLPAGRSLPPVGWRLQGHGDSGGDGPARLEAPAGLAVARGPELPGRARLRLRFEPAPGTERFGLRLRTASGFDSGYDLSFSPHERIVRLCDLILTAVEGLERSVDVDVVLYDDLIDVCVQGQRTFINRCPRSAGQGVYCYALNGAVAVSPLSVEKLG